MIYTDGIHMIGESLEELHNFAKLINLNKCWFHNGKIPHYDLMKSKEGRKEMFKRALSKGAIHCSSKKLIKISWNLKK